MRSDKFLTIATRQLRKAGIGTARLDTLVLLEDVTGKDRTWLLAQGEFELSAVQTAKLKKLLNRRAEHEPLAYIRGKAEFYGREFVLTPDVLQPRPESETMIDLLKALPLFTSRQAKKGTQLYIADVGAGSGALGITAALEVPGSAVELLEIDPNAAKIAKMNVDKFTLPTKVTISDLLAKATQDYDVLLCNLPYVPDGFQLNPAAMQEPRLAIFGGPDGLDIYRRLFKQLAELPNQPLYILTESMPPQHDELTLIAGEARYKLQQTEDFIQVFQAT